MLKTVSGCTSACWEKVFTAVNRAVVFIDNACAELLHWQGGLLCLLNAGAMDVKEFTSFECALPSQKKGVFIVSSVVEGVTREVIHDVVEASQFQYTMVITAVSGQAHLFSRTGTLEGDSQNLFTEIEDELLEWMGNMNYTAEVIHVPLFTISLSPTLFLTPAYSKLFPLVDTDLHQVSLQYNTSHGRGEQRSFVGLQDVEAAALPKELQIYFKTFISSVNSLMEGLGVREDIYCLGHTSRILATELENYGPAKSRRKTAQQRASIVFVDRTLDLAGPVSHTMETLLDKIMDVLPRLPGHSTDVAVEMAGLCMVKKSVQSGVIAPGCLASSSGASQPHLKNAITAKLKDALMDVNRQIMEAAVDTNLPVSLKGKPTRITAEQLQSILELFRGKYSAISSNLDSVQVAMATVQTLNSPIMHRCDELLSVEKGLLQSLADSDDGSSVLPEMLKLVQEVFSTERLTRQRCGLDEILCLLVYIYSLAGSDITQHAEQEQELQVALVQSVVEQLSNLPDVMSSIVGEGTNDCSIVKDILDDMWEKLHAIAESRDHLQQYRSVLDPGSAVSPASHNGLLKQLLGTIFDPAKPELIDLEYKSSGFTDMLKKGFGLFRTVAKPRPSDHPLMILFIVGGVTSTEVKQIKDVVNTYKPDTQVIVGSTRLLKPLDVVYSVLRQNNVNLTENS